MRGSLEQAFRHAAPVPRWILMPSIVGMRVLTTVSCPFESAARGDCAVRTRKEALQRACNHLSQISVGLRLMFYLKFGITHLSDSKSSKACIGMQCHAYAVVKAARISVCEKAASRVRKRQTNVLAPRAAEPDIEPAQCKAIAPRSVARSLCSLDKLGSLDTRAGSYARGADSVTSR